MRFFKIAQKLNKHYEEVLKDKKLHFRGNRGSFSLISLDRETPEQGKGGFTKEEQGVQFLQDKIDSYLADKRRKIEAGGSRQTREKELQAWIINYAINNRYQLPFSSGLTFLTSELAFVKPEKIVNDILAFDQNGCLVVIELKSSRDKTTLEGQVKRFFDKIDGNKDFFEELVQLLAHEKTWNMQKRGMIVWPDSKFEPNVNGLSKTGWKHGIVEIRYKEILDENGQHQIYYNGRDEIVFLDSL
jgi:hypothetical protein